MFRIWLLQSPSAPLTWVYKTLRTRFPSTQVSILDNRATWKRATQRQPWPDIVITPLDLPWTTAEKILLQFKNQNLSVPILLVSDHATEGQLARLLDLGIHAYLPYTPPQPLLLAAHVRRLLRHDPQALAMRLSFLEEVDSKLLMSDNTRTIAQEALQILARTVQAQWGFSAFVNKKQSPIAEILGGYPSNEPSHPFQPGERHPLETLPVIPSPGEWAVHPVDDLPPSPLRETLQAQGLRWVGVYRLFIGPELYGLLHLGWRRKSDISPSGLRFAGSTARWLSAIVYRVLRLSAERDLTHQWQTTTHLMLSLNRSLDSDTIWQRLLKGIREVVPYEQASIWQRNPDGTFTVHYLEGYDVSCEQFNTSISHLPLPPEQWTTFTIISETKRPLLIPDTTKFPAWQRLDFTEHIRCWLGIPVVYDDALLGILALDASQPHTFTTQHLQTAQTLITAATIALENARLFEIEQRRRQQLNALRLASLQLVSSLDIREVLANLLQQAVSLVSAADAHIFFYDGQKLSFVASFWENQIRPRPLQEPRTHGITYTVARSGQPYIVPSVRDDPLFHDAPWDGAIIGLPLISHRRVLGVMNIAWHEPHQFTQEEIEILKMLADYAAIALENARLVGDLQGKIQQLSTLSKASAALRESQTIQEAAQNLARQAVILSNAQHALVTRFIDEEKRQIVIEAVVGLSPGLIGRFFPLEESGLTAHLLQNDRELILEDLAHSPILKHREWVEQTGPAVALPLRTRSGEMVGMLLVGRAYGAPSFTEEEIPPLRTLAEIGATALQRSQSLAALEEAFIQAALALAEAMDARDTYHGGHSKQLAEWAVAVAREMGLSEEEIETIRLAGLLHDIGKIGIPDEILLKPGPLTPEEWAIMRTHPTIGAQILRPLRRLQPVAEIVEAHHERWDGSGYPKGLKGEEIPIGARILAVVDSYGAMIDRRVYHEPISREAAIAEIRAASGRLYDPKVVRAFEAVVEYLGSADVKA